MPLLFIGTGLVFLLTGIKGDAAKLFGLLQGDFQGENNFIYWFFSILVLGSLGYIKHLENLSRVFIALVVVVLLLDNKGFFAKLQEFIDSSKTVAKPTAGAGGSF